jgi:hypothetical protein
MCNCRDGRDSFGHGRDPDGDCDRKGGQSRGNKKYTTMEKNSGRFGGADPMWCVVSRRNLDMMAAAGRVALFVLHVRAGMPRTLMLRWAARLQLASLVQVVRNYDDELVEMMSWLDLALSSPLRISLREENVLFLTGGGLSLFSKDMVLLL